ncbi:MAG: CHAT domain-containing protein [Rhizonema sp. NSF051]|nr:CHAT domain-containing protein [Rhizonema sp. NSF051]
MVIAREIQDRQGQGQALNNLGRVLLRTGKTTEATQRLIEAIKIWEYLRARLNDSFKVSIFQEQARTYRFLQKALAYQNKTDAALEIAERGRSRAFLELLATHLSSVATPKLPSIEQIQQIAKAQNATLVEYSIIDDDFQIKGKQQTRESELFIWVVKPTGEVTFRRVDLKPLWQQHNSSLANLSVNIRDCIGERRMSDSCIELFINKQSLQQFHQRLKLDCSGVKRGTMGFSCGPTIDKDRADIYYLQQLHQLLIKPIADLLPTDPKADVVFIPEQSLSLVPFVALQDAEGKYLIEKHTIRTSPSMHVLDLTHRQAQEVRGLAKDILIVGNPTMPKVSFRLGEPPQQLNPLPAAEKEARTVAAIFNIQAITGNQASKAAVVKQMLKAKFIHLATHSFADDFKRLGIPGVIALAPSGRDDGWLTASEIQDLKLSAELVVLSSCDSGGGKITGDGIIGLSRSFIIARVPSMIVALWAIEDQSTADLMIEFYRNLQHNPDKAQALRLAMLSMVANPRYKPRDWAAFTLIGEGQ